MKSTNGKTAPELWTGKSNIWHRLTDAFKQNTGMSFVAVAYFSKGASKMLPLNKGSILVVDASENTVKAGQTCPAELLELYKVGVRIYTYSGLHAKLFVCRDTVFIGSTNASAYSAIYLEEALLKCCDIKIIEQSIGFIKSLCSKELGFEALTELQKKYREPKFNNPLGKRTRKKGDVDNLNKVHVVKLRILVRSYDINSKDYVTGKAKAEKAIQDWDRHNIEDYKYSIDGRPKIGDVVIRIINNKGKVSVSAPATILNIQPIAKTKQSFVFVEAPNKKDKSLKTVNAFLKSDELTRAGQKGHDLAAKLNSLWT